jgi:hypothetical protein
MYELDHAESADAHSCPVCGCVEMIQGHDDAVALPATRALPTGLTPVLDVLRGIAASVVGTRTVVRCSRCQTGTAARNIAGCPMPEPPRVPSPATGGSTGTGRAGCRTWAAWQIFSQPSFYVT